MITGFVPPTLITRIASKEVASWLSATWFLLNFKVAIEFYSGSVAWLMKVLSGAEGKRMPRNDATKDAAFFVFWSF